jgi:geranylgeranyl diphosphate synthase type I
VANSHHAVPAQPADGRHAPALWKELTARFISEGGVLGEMCRHALATPGKLFRPILLLQSAEAVGGRVEHVLPAAVGTEVGHIASLVHDDVIDGDDLRRGQPSVQAKFGANSAIVAGDVLLFELFRCLAECRNAGAPDDRIVSALDVVSRAGIDLCRGQSLESELTAAGSRDLDRYVLMIKLKTGALFSGACRAGAILGGGGPEQVSALGRFGDDLGIAFQVCDDLLTYIGLSDEAIGKSLISDIRNKRMTLPVIFAYAEGRPEIEEQLDGVFGERADPADALATVRDLMTRTGAVERSRELALAHARRAVDVLDVLEPSPSRDQLAQYAIRAIDRVR